MIERRAAPDRVPIPRLVYLSATAAIILLAGFLLLQTPPVAAAFSAVSELLALCASAILRTVGYPVILTGIELRDSVTGHAIAVTQACDGSSLLIAAVAVTLWLWRPGKRDLLLLAATALIALFGFNLLRVVLLFVSVGTSGLMELQHLYIAPLLSAVLVAGIVLVGLGLTLRDTVRSPILWLVVAIVAAVVWYPVTETVTCVTVVPLANTLLWLAPGELERAIICDPGGTIVSTYGVVSYEPLRVLDASFYSSDFTLALPLVAASLTLARRPVQVVRGALVSIALMAVAMTLGAMTASQDAAIGASVTTLMGRGFSAPFAPTSDTFLALMKAAQNALVHFNLFVLPLALLHDRPSPPKQAQPPRRRSGNRGSRR